MQRFCLFMLLLAVLAVQSSMALINSVADLYLALQASSNKKVGFGTVTNYNSVAKVLPSSVVPVYYAGGVSDIEKDVTNGVLFAGFVSGDVPAGQFNYFSSRVISGQGMFTLGTPMLLKVLNAAISQVQRAATPQTLIRNYSGKLFTEIDSCSTSSGAFPWPSLTELDNYGETWWGSSPLTGCRSGGTGCYIRIGTLYTKFDWFYDYTVTPPTGFYADYASALSDAIVAQYGASRNFKGFQRVIDQTKTTSSALLAVLASQVAPGAATFDASDMFFYYTSTFTGTVTQSGTTYSGEARTTVFDATCVVLGGDGSFFTTVDKNQSIPVLSSGAIAGIVIGGVAGLAACIFAGWLVVRERAGKPIFTKLIDQDEAAVAPAEEEKGGKPPYDPPGLALTGVAPGSASLQQP